MHKVIINGKTKYAQNGTLLSDMLLSDADPVEHICAGKGICKKCTVSVNGQKVLSCQYRITSDIEVFYTVSGKIHSETGASVTGIQAIKPTDKLCFALDIGTTTLAVALIDTDEKKIIGVTTRNNPQRSFGADIMSRIEYCRKHGTDALHQKLITEINSMIASFGCTAKTLFVSGNTTMLHLFFGIDCSSIGVYPYTPAFLGAKTEKAEVLGISGVGTVISLPCIASFAGADITAGLNCVTMPEPRRHSLLVDLGTNAEIVLFSENDAICTAAAAGPCFEGANISCGMSATPGAIYSYSPGSIKTIGNTTAKGVCGTGLIDIIAYYLKTGIIDESGYTEDDIEIINGITVTQSDIRQYQLAKSAVCSAVLTMMKQKNVTFDDIETLYISGGFSGKINTENAVITGLLPGQLKHKCTAINNSSLLGTVKYALENNPLEKICRNTLYTDLSSDPTFSDLFIENMMFN